MLLVASFSCPNAVGQSQQLVCAPSPLFPNNHPLYGYTKSPGRITTAALHAVRLNAVNYFELRRIIYRDASKFPFAFVWARWILALENQQINRMYVVR